MPTNDDPIQLLTQSQQKIRLVLKELLEYRTELAKHVDKEKSGSFSAGLQAIDQAIQAARKMEQDIEEALQNRPSKSKE